jgi:hypothetical protein
MSEQSYYSHRLKLAILEQGLKRPQYEVWNIASLENVIQAIRGKYGPKGNEIGIQLAENFYSWYIGKTYGTWEYIYSYVSETESGEDKKSFPSSSEIRKMIDNAKDEYARKHDSEEEIDEI